MDAKMQDKATDIKTVSVVMCTYNGARFLREQLDSILAQDYPLHEIIIQDDGSTDDTLSILDDYRRQYPTLFRIHRNANRLGFNRNFHTAMLRATGEFIAISDQDDVWFPTKIRRQVETIGACDLCLTDVYHDATFTQPLKMYVSQTTYFEQMLFYGSGAGHTMLLRTDFVKSIDTWDYTIFYDHWLGIQAHLHGGVTKVAEPLNWHRRYAGSVTTPIKKKGRWQPVDHPTWHPYVLGYFYRLHMQRQGNYQRFYAYVEAHADRERFPLVWSIAHLLRKRNPLAMLRLCCICGRNWRTVYHKNPQGLSGRIHGFFCPIISAYGCGVFSLEKSAKD